MMLVMQTSVTVCTVLRLLEFGITGPHDEQLYPAHPMFYGSMVQFYPGHQIEILAFEYLFCSFLLPELERDYESLDPTISSNLPARTLCLRITSAHSSLSSSSSSDSFASLRNARIMLKSPPSLPRLPAQ